MVEMGKHVLPAMMDGDMVSEGGVGFSEETCVKKGMKVVTGKGKTTTRFPMMPGATEVTVKLIFTEEGKLVGGQVVGGEAAAEDGWSKL